MNVTPANEESALERAEAIVTRVGEEADRLARLTVALTVEFAQDVWAEAQSIRGEGSSEH